MPADDPVRKLALSAIDADTQARDLLSPGAATGRVAFPLLYRYANDPGYELSPENARKLASDPAAQADLERLISAAAIAYVPRQAAAASGDVRRRETEAAVLTLIPSKADAGQVYLGIELRNPEGSMPVQLFTGKPGASWLRLALPAFSAARAQVLLDANSDIAQLLSDPGAEVYLR